MKQLALTIPGYGKLETPPNIPTGADAPSNIIQTGINLFMLVGIVAALIFLLYGGVLWTTSGGDKGKVDRARKTITFSIVGLIVMILAFVIIQAVGYILGSEYLSNFGGKGIQNESQNPDPAGIRTPTACTTSGGYCISGMNCGPGETGIGTCNTSPIQACCRKTP